MLSPDRVGWPMFMPDAGRNCERCFEFCPYQMAPGCSVAIVTGQPRVSPGQRVGLLFVAEITELCKLFHPQCGGEQRTEGDPGTVGWQL